jgi:HEAT repeat protein
LVDIMSPGSNIPSSSIRLPEEEFLEIDLTEPEASGETEPQRASPEAEQQELRVRPEESQETIRERAKRIAAAEPLLKDATVQTRFDALELLRGGSREELALLVRALHDKSPRVAKKAVAILGETKAPEALALLWNAMQGVSRDRQVPILDVLKGFDLSSVAMLARQSLGSRQVRDRILGVWALSSLEDPDLRPSLLGALADPAPEVRAEALSGLATDPSVSVVPDVAARLRDPEETIRVQAIGILTAVEDDSVLPHLLDAAKDPSVAVQEEAKASLLTREPQTVVPLLLDALGSAVHRRTARDLLSDMGPRAIEGLIEALPQASDEVKSAIGELLQEAGAVPRLLEELSDPDPDRRLLAVEAIGAVGGTDATTELAARLTDPVADVRSRAALALGRSGDKKAIEPLKRVFVADPDLSVVAAIETALRELTGAGPDSES